jgi:hypothetical protein
MAHQSERLLWGPQQTFKLRDYWKSGSDPDFSSLAGLDPGFLHHALVALGVALDAREELGR